MYYPPATHAGHITLLFVSLLCITSIVNIAAVTPAVPIDYTTVYSDPDGPNGNATYDYIVVGVGQTGSIVASRLAGKNSVLGIEAGDRSQRVLNGTDYVAASMYYDSNGHLRYGTPFTRFDVPQYFTTIYVQPSTYFDWPAMFNGIASDSYVGRYLGGSGVHNGMIFVRFTQETINAWNISGWSYNDLLPYYKLTENVTGSATALLPNASYYHGTSGPIQVSDTPQNEYYASVPIWLAACNASGYPENPDINGASRYGCGLQVYNIRRGVRDSAAAAYLPKALAKGNLTLSLNSYVTRVLIKKGAPTTSTSGKINNPVAYGVEYVFNGTTYRVFARKEVIICANALLTPKVLMLSGIGPASLLTSLGIPVWKNNTNVGVGLSANQISFGSFAFPGAVYPNGLKISAAATAYAINGTGPWSHAGQFAYLYACSNNQTMPPGPNQPKPPCVDPDIMVATAVGGNLASQTSSSNTISTQISTCRPKVRGVVTILDNNYQSPVNVTMDDFAHIEDVNAIIYGFRLLRQVFSLANTTFGAEIQPGPGYDSDYNLTQWIHATSLGARAHYVGTARMVNPGDTTGVCDTQMRVQGIDNLRIGDTSVVPSVNSHTSATAVAIAERCAAFILNITYV